MKVREYLGIDLNSFAFRRRSARVPLSEHLKRVRRGVIPSPRPIRVTLLIEKAPIPKDAAMSFMLSSSIDLLSATDPDVASDNPLMTRYFSFFLRRKTSLQRLSAACLVG